MTLSEKKKLPKEETAVMDHLCWWPWFEIGIRILQLGQDSNLVVFRFPFSFLQPESSLRGPIAGLSPIREIRFHKLWLVLHHLFLAVAIPDRKIVGPNLNILAFQVVRVHLKKKIPIDLVGK